MAPIHHSVLSTVSIIQPPMRATSEVERPALQRAKISMTAL